MRGLSGIHICPSPFVPMPRVFVRRSILEDTGADSRGGIKILRAKLARAKVYRTRHEL